MIISYKIALLCGPICFFYQAIGALSTIDFHIVTCIFILDHPRVFTPVKILKYFLIHNFSLFGRPGGLSATIPRFAAGFRFYP